MLIAPQLKRCFATCCVLTPSRFYNELEHRSLRALPEYQFVNLIVHFRALRQEYMDDARAMCASVAFSRLLRAPGTFLVNYKVVLLLQNYWASLIAIMFYFRVIFLVMKVWHGAYFM